ncbi:MAG: hypothetical protein ABIU63_08585 [Chitinophagaceae bacterium]
MRIFTILFLITFNPVIAPAQLSAMDTLKQYSYYVFGNQPTPDGQFLQKVEGTCFFVQKGEDVFLVSAKHLMTGWSTADAEKQLLYPDTLYIRFPITGSSGFVDFPVDIRAIKQGVLGSYYYNEPDLFIMPFPEAANFNVSIVYVDALALASAENNAISVVYGFPKEAPFYLEGRVFSLPGERISYRDHKRNADVNDTINYLIKCGGEVQGGYSGAPVFLKNEDASTWHFGGVVSQGVPRENYFFVVKPVFLQQLL